MSISKQAFAVRDILRSEQMKLRAEGSNRAADALEAFIQSASWSQHVRLRNALMECN